MARAARGGAAVEGSRWKWRTPGRFAGKQHVTRTATMLAAAVCLVFVTGGDASVLQGPFEFPRKPGCPGCNVGGGERAAEFGVAGAVHCFEGSGDCVAAFDVDDGARQGVDVVRSENFGRTWTVTASFQDSIASGNARTSPRVSCADDTCIVMWRFGASQVRFARSLDRGKTFGVEQSTPLSADGRVDLSCFVTPIGVGCLAVANLGGDNEMRMSRSDDGGASFSGSFPIVSSGDGGTNSAIDCLDDGTRCVIAFREQVFGTVPELRIITADENGDRVVFSGPAEVEASVSTLLAVGDSAKAVEYVFPAVSCLNIQQCVCSVVVKITEGVNVTNTLEFSRTNDGGFTWTRLEPISSQFGSSDALAHSDIECVQGGDSCTIVAGRSEGANIELDLFVSSNRGISFSAADPVSALPQAGVHQFPFLDCGKDKRCILGVQTVDAGITGAGPGASTILFVRGVVPFENDVFDEKSLALDGDGDDLAGIGTAAGIISGLVFVAGVTLLIRRRKRRGADFGFPKMPNFRQRAPRSGPFFTFTTSLRSSFFPRSRRFDTEEESAFDLTPRKVRKLGSNAPGFDQQVVQYHPNGGAMVSTVMQPHERTAQDPRHGNPRISSFSSFHLPDDLDQDQEDFPGPAGQSRQSTTSSGTRWPSFFRNIPRVKFRPVSHPEPRTSDQRVSLDV